MDSHSPGSLLKEIYLYSVLNTQIFTTEKVENRFVVCNLDLGETKDFQDEASATDYLKSKNQRAHYWVSNKKFVKYQSFSGQEVADSLNSTSNILQGMTALLKANQTTLPVVNEKSELIGVFSEEALSAL